MKAGETREVKFFVPDLNQVGISKMTARGEEVAELGDRSKRPLLRIDATTTDLNGKPLPGMDSTYWVDSGGQILKAADIGSAHCCSAITPRMGSSFMRVERERKCQSPNWSASGITSHEKMPLSVPPPRGSRFGSALVLSRVHWVRPEMVVEVSYVDWTPEGLLRHVVYLGEREDKAAINVRRDPLGLIRVKPS